LDSRSKALEWDEPWLTVGDTVFRTISLAVFIKALQQVDAAREAFAEEAETAPPSANPPPC
jgi:hypothetical protein